MSQLRDWLWGYYREHGQVPENLSTLLEMARQEEMMPLVVDVTAMQMVRSLRGKGRDLTVEQQAQGMVP
ncbi:hypothetical protein KSF_103490 [Reticulibacter mediterranei]|uniref:Uncharacterized protein n=1 Tax=Reticulibacter mediterranei TaxID=2778369 RepID=A0A8J3IT53_9CHLR|nr:hypothetical protein [Reticulibacter mediterranei]GHP00302.1 hypothetical protein KSF_103490 [Reticulibacter mediterranei]